jgi:hypothetical protein
VRKFALPPLISQNKIVAKFFTYKYYDTQCSGSGSAFKLTPDPHRNADPDPGSLIFTLIYEFSPVVLKIKACSCSLSLHYEKMINCPYIHNKEHQNFVAKRPGSGYAFDWRPGSRSGSALRFWVGS